MVENRSAIDELIDEDGITIFSTFEHIFLVLNTMVFWLSGFAIIRGSTKQMGVYRWYLLNEVVWSFLFDLSATFFQPVYVIQGVLCGTVTSVFFRYSNSYVARILLLLSCMTFIAKTHAFASALVHRFVCAFPEYSRVSQVYRFVTPWVHIGILILPFSFILILQVPFMLANDQKEKREKTMQEFPITQELYKYESATACVSPSDYSKVVGVGIVGIAFFAFLFLVYGFLFLYTRHLLEKQRQLTIHVQTLKLQQMLLRACAVQILGNFAFLFIPLIAFILLLASRPFHSQLYISIVYSMFSVNSIFNYMCLIGFIRSYREITANKIRQLGFDWLKRSQSNQNITIVQSCQTSL